MDRLRARHGERCTPLVFLLIRPDAVRQGLSWKILDELRRESLTPLEIGVVRPHPRQLEELYLQTQIRMAEARQRPMWWYMPRYYELAPAAAVLLTGWPDETGVAERLTVLKGPANPAQTRPGQLRYRYRSQNMLMSVVHSSEDAHAAIREACLFFGEQRVDAAISRRRPAVLDAAGIPAAPAMLPTFHQIVATTQIALLDRINPRIRHSRDAAAVRAALERARDGSLTDPVYRHRTLGMRGTCSPAFEFWTEVPAAYMLTDSFERIAGATMVPLSHLLWAACWSGIAAAAFHRAQQAVRGRMRSHPDLVDPRLAAAAERMGQIEAVLAAAARRYEPVWAEPGAVDEHGGPGRCAT